MHHKNPRRWLAVSAAMLLTMGGLYAGSAPDAHAAWGGYSIDGAVPDPDLTAWSDPSGSTKELGPTNGSPQQLGVIHLAAPKMLSLTNPNGQVDLRNVWFDTTTDGDGTWLYFAWERDASSGSGFLSIEFQKSAPPAVCTYPIDAAVCNPWTNRAAGDFLLLWDQQGGSSRDIYLRTFDGTSWGAPVPLASAKAEFSADGFFGEAAVNLTAAGILDPTKCVSVGNVIPGTVTGNSDSADYKDTVFAPIADALNIRNCGTVTINKVTVPTSYNQNFAFNGAFQTLATATKTAQNPVGAFTLNTWPADTTPSTMTWDNVKVSAASGSVTEAITPNWTLTSISCVSNGDNDGNPSVSLATRMVTFTVDSPDDVVNCTFTNEGVGAIDITKLAKHAAAPGGEKPLAGVTFTLTGPGDDITTAGTNAEGKVCVPGLGFGSYTVTEVASSAPGYQAAAAQAVTVDSASDCGANRASAETVSFTNIPLTDLTVSVAPQVAGATASSITCKVTGAAPILAPTPNDTTPTAFNDTSETVKDLVPGSYTCVVVIDP